MLRHVMVCVGAERIFRLHEDIGTGRMSECVSGEVVLCAGVFGSPRILSNSLNAPLTHSHATTTTTATATSTVPLKEPHCTHHQVHSTTHDEDDAHAHAHAHAHEHEHDHDHDHDHTQREFFDHTVLPFMAIGNWWVTGSGSNSVGVRDSSSVGVSECISGTGDSGITATLPPNSVHGWVYLDAAGRQVCGDSKCASASASASASESIPRFVGFIMLVAK
jgi:hypothetical protein